MLKSDIGTHGRTLFREVWHHIVTHHVPTWKIYCSVMVKRVGDSVRAASTQPKCANCWKNPTRKLSLAQGIRIIDDFCSYDCLIENAQRNKRNHEQRLKARTEREYGKIMREPPKGR